MSKESKPEVIETATESQVREKAYELWEKAGSPNGNPDDFWIQAEQILNKS